MFTKMGDLRRISRILKSISLFIQSYVTFRSMIQIDSGLDDNYIAFWRMKMASVVDRLLLKPNCELVISFSYAFIVINITNDARTFEHVDIIDSPL